MTGRLFLGPIADDFHPQRDIVAGPWCFVDRESICPGWETLDFVEPFDTPAIFVSTERDLAALIDDLACEWGRRLNARHGVSRPAVFWHRYLLLWLSLAVMATWARWRNMEELVRRHGTKPLVVPAVAPKPAYDLRDFPAFFDHLLNDASFQLALDSQIARRLASPEWTIVDDGGMVSGATVRQASSETPSDDGSHLSKAVRALLPRLALDHLPGVGASKLLWSVFIELLPRRIAAAPKPITEGNGRKLFPAAYLEFLDDFLTRTTPDSIGGQLFRHLDGKAARRRYVPGRLFVANTRAVGDTQRLEAAHALAAGERLVNAQHGGWEGTAAAVSWNAHIYAQDHAYLTWGWTRQAGLPGRCVPFVAPELAPLRNKHRDRDNNLVMVGARMALNGMRFDCVPRPRAMVRYRAAKVRFLTSLSDEVRAATRYRSYMRAPCDLEDGSFMTRSLPGLRLLTGDLHRALLRCRLLVLDHPGTTLHIALAANVPMVWFWNQDDWPLCSEAQPYFDALEACGVLYRTAEDAARQVDRIWPNVQSWWTAPAIALAVGRCRQHYARTAPYASFRLARTLWDLSRLAPTDAETVRATQWHASARESER